MTHRDYRLGTSHLIKVPLVTLYQECRDKVATDWYFMPIPPGMTNRDPIAGAFFANEAVSRPGEALVREGIQNSLDASEGKKAFVCISFWSDSQALGPEVMASYFDGAWSHYTATKNGLHPDDVPRPSTPFSALIFEDIGARGLEGDPAEPFPPEEGQKNHFYHFFRAEGQTDKDSSKRGSWGIGKDALLRASRVNTLFGLTIRESDGRRLLMGKTVLKAHKLNQVPFQDGFYGVVPNQDQDLVLPIEEEGIIDDFIRLFKLQRRNETGLSVVIPWPDEEIDEVQIIQAVLRDYFYVILSGALDVIVETPSIKTVLDSNNLKQEAIQCDAPTEVVQAIELAEWAVRDDIERSCLNMPNPQHAWGWGQELFSDGLAESLRQQLEQNEPLAIHVPVTVRKRANPPRPSYFDIYIRRNGTDESSRPWFIRNGILISDVRAPQMRGMTSLVVIDDEPLSELLRCTENPSHSIWQSQQAKKDYAHGVISDISFVVNSVRAVYDLIMAEDKKEDKRLLTDIFSIPGEEVEPPPPTPRPVRISKLAGGFAVTKGKDSIPKGTNVVIRLAYDIRRGQSLPAYRPTDFQVDQEPIHLSTPQGCTVLESVYNRIVLKVDDADSFRLDVTGFDGNRQLYVDWHTEVP